MNNYTVAREYFETGPSESEDYDPAFKGKPMWWQFGKIEDSQTLEGVIKPKKLKKVTTVVTDDDEKFTLTAKEVKTIKEIILAFPMPERADVFRKIQSKKGLTSLVKRSKINSVSNEVINEIWNEMNE